MLQGKLKCPSINDVGKFSGFLTPPSPMSAVFLVLSAGNFDQFFIPPPGPYQLPTSLMDDPKAIARYSKSIPNLGLKFKLFLLVSWLVNYFHG